MALGWWGPGAPPVAHCPLHKGKGRVRRRGNGETLRYSGLFSDLHIFPNPVHIGKGAHQSLEEFYLDLSGSGFPLVQCCGPHYQTHASLGLITATQINIWKNTSTLLSYLITRSRKWKVYFILHQDYQNFTFRLVIILMEPRLVIMTLLKISEILTTLLSETRNILYHLLSLLEPRIWNMKCYFDC